MFSEWRQVTLGDGPLQIIDGDRGKNYPSQRDFESKGHCLFLNAGNVTEDGFAFADCSFISTERDEALRKGKLQRNDIVLTTRGTVGNTAFFDAAVPFENVRINSGMVLLRANPAALLPRFLYFFVRSPLFKQQVAALLTGSAQPQLPIRDINQIKMPLPGLREQQAIVEMLAVLDDKIQLNRKVSATLEATGRALFKSWFVDFDPVRAKAEGRDTGLPQEIAALFPNSFEYSELGEIPSGWEVKCIAELGRVTTGKTPSTKTAGYFDGPYPFITIPDLDGRMHIDRTSRTLSEAGADAIKGSRLPRGAVMMSCIATVGRCGITERISFTNQQINAVTCNSLVKPEFLYWAFKHLGDEVERSGGGGSVYTNVSKSRFSNIQILIPPLALQTIFAGPWFEKSKCNASENSTLSQMRDALLPKLISGEIRVTDAERIVEKSA